MMLDWSLLPKAIALFCIIAYTWGVLYGKYNCRKSTYEKHH